MDAISYAHADDAYGRVIVIENEGRVYYKLKTDDLSDIPKNRIIVIIDADDGPVEFLLDPGYTVDPGESYDDLFLRDFLGFIHTTNVNQFIKTTTPILAASHTTQNEEQEVSITITNYDAFDAYVIDVSAGTYIRVDDVITWTLPSVLSNTNHNITVTAQTTNILVSDPATKVVTVVDVPVNYGQEILYDSSNIHIEFPTYSYNNDLFVDNYTLLNYFYEDRENGTFEPQEITNINVNTVDHEISPLYKDKESLLIHADSTAGEILSYNPMAGEHNYKIDGLDFTGIFGSSGGKVTDPSPLSILARGPAISGIDGSLDGTPQDGTVTSVYISVDGTRAFTTGSDNDNVYSYTLSTPYNIATGTHEYSYPTGDTATMGVAFNTTTDTDNEGEIMYILNGGGVSITRFELTTGFDLSTASVVSTFDLSGDLSGVNSFYFSPNGSKLFVYSDGNNMVVRYDMATPWDLTTAILNPVSYGINRVDFPIWFNFYGTKMYSINSGEFEEFDLSTPWDLSTVSSATISTHNVNNTFKGIYFDESGVRCYGVDNGDNVYQWSFGDRESIHGTPLHALDIASLALGTVPTEAYVDEISVKANSIEQEEILADFIGLSSITSKEIAYNLARNSNVADLRISMLEAPMIGMSEFNTISEGDLLLVDDGAGELVELDTTGRITITSTGGEVNLSDPAISEISFEFGHPVRYAEFSVDGLLVFTNDTLNEILYSYRLNVAFDINSIDIASGPISQLPTAQTDQMRGFFFKSDGLSLWIAEYSSSKIHYWTLRNAWDLNSAIYEYSVNPPSVGKCADIHISENGEEAYIAGGTDSDRIYQFSLNIPWDINTLVYVAQTDAENDLDDPYGFCFNENGNKMLVIDADSTDRIIELELGTPWNLATAVKTGNTYSIPNADQSGIAITPRGNQLLICKNGNNFLYTLNLTGSFNNFDSYSIDTAGINNGIPKVAIIPNTDNIIKFEIGGEDTGYVQAVKKLDYLITTPEMNIPSVEVLTTYEDIKDMGNTSDMINTMVELTPVSSPITQISATTLTF